MHSMTGFGQAAGENGRYRVSVTLRGVNHRFLDLSLRGLEDRELEPALRELVASRLSRGRVEATFEIVAVGPRRVEIGVDEEAVRSLRALTDRLADQGLVARQIGVGDLLRLPELVLLEAGDPEWCEDDRKLLLELTAEALEQLLAARATEGGQLRRAIEERLAALGAIAGELRELRAGKGEEMARQLEERIAEIVRDRVDADRIALEAAILVDKSDVAEELDRLESHLDHLRAILDQEGGVGKRLDFLAQEIFRELNTVAAKCRDSEMTQRVVEGKTLCEQIREQVQNVE
jgi:uncharacterized protein (TIGR00255 family)